MLKETRERGTSTKPTSLSTSLINGYYNDQYLNVGLEPGNCCDYQLVDEEINGIELFTYHEDEPSPNVDITIKGKKKEDDGIFLVLRYRYAQLQPRVQTQNENGAQVIERSVEAKRQLKVKLGKPFNFFS